MRKDGFYWVKFRDSEEWTIAEYNSEYKGFPWIKVGSYRPFRDEDFSEIGERITKEGFYEL